MSSKAKDHQLLFLKMGKMEQNGEMGYYGDELEHFNAMENDKEDSGSGNNDTLSIEDHPQGAFDHNNNKNKGVKRKKYNRHTPNQIQELENFFKVCNHPDEKQRLLIGKRLGLESRQVKFWFQNRRTQMKTQVERHENIVLKQEFDKLRAENDAMKDAVRNPMCRNCGGPTILGDVSMDMQHQLCLENARLKDELTKVRAITEKYLGKPISELLAPITPNSNLNLSVTRGRLNNNVVVSPPALPVGVNLENGVSCNTSSITTSMNGSMMSSEYEKTMLLQAAMAAMDELLAMVQPDSPLWFKGLNGERDVLNLDEYVKKLSPFVGMKPCGFGTDATRETGSVFITSLELVETMMLPNRCQDMFTCVISNATTMEVLCKGANGTRDGELQLINMEYVYPSPLVPLRQDKLLRFSKQHSEGMWAVVDVSVEAIRGLSFSTSSNKSRKLPSGCIVQDVANGYSLVTWIEHVEYDESCVHHLYQPLLQSGLAFGAQRWLATLQRECEGASIFMSAPISPEDHAETLITQDGRRSISKLMKRVSNNFCSGLCTSSTRRWERLQVGGLAPDVQLLTRVSVNEPGEPSGVVLSVSTSVWMSIPRQKLFDFLRDEKQRGNWDILANGGPMEVIACLPKSHDGTSYVSLFCPPAMPTKESNMLILQESWTDPTGSSIVYAPVNLTSVESVLRGGDSDFLALLPSGFSIADGPIHPDHVALSNGVEGPGPGSTSVLTIGFQILVNNLPTAKLTVESIYTVNSLMSCTIQKIRNSLGIN